MSDSRSVLSDSATCNLQAPPSMGFSRQECWSGLAFPSPGDLPNAGIKPGYPTFQADSLPSEPLGKLLPKCITLTKIKKIILKRKPIFSHRSLCTITQHSSSQDRALFFFFNIDLAVLGLSMAHSPLSRHGEGA